MVIHVQNMSTEINLGQKMIIKIIRTAIVGKNIDFQIPLKMVIQKMNTENWGFTPSGSQSTCSQKELENQ